MSTVSNKVKDKLAPIKVATSNVIALKTSGILQDSMSHTIFLQLDPTDYRKILGKLLVNAITLVPQYHVLLLADVRNESFVNYCSYSADIAPPAYWWFGMHYYTMLTNRCDMERCNAI
jgi:hypothetical protein